MKFLSILKEPCEELAELNPNQVAPKLKFIITLIRIIWNNNKCYSTSERVADLFHMVHSAQTRTHTRTNRFGVEVKTAVGF